MPPINRASAWVELRIKSSVRDPRTANLVPAIMGRSLRDSPINLLVVDATRPQNPETESAATAVRVARSRVSSECSQRGNMRIGRGNLGGFGVPTATSVLESRLVLGFAHAMENPPGADGIRFSGLCYHPIVRAAPNLRLHGWVPPHQRTTARARSLRPEPGPTRPVQRLRAALPGDEVDGGSGYSPTNAPPCACRMKVTGPSLTSSTFMSAAKRPVATSMPSARIRSAMRS